MTSYRHFTKYADTIVLLALAALIIVLAWVTGNITDPPRLVDENQIFEFIAKAETRGFMDAAIEHFEEKALVLRRFVPVYLAHKLACASVYGTNLVLWSLHIAIIGAATCCLLYLACRHMSMNIIESISFVLIAALGSQSIIWLRLFNGESIGLFFLSLALYSMARGYKAEGVNNWDRLFVIAATLASMSKESFILILPALAYWRFMLVRRRYGFSSDRAWQRDRGLYQILGAVFALDLAFILLVVRRTKVGYTGFEGFAIEPFVAIVSETFSLERAWLFWVMTILVLVSWLTTKEFGTGIFERAKNFIRQMRGPAIIVLLILIPQWILYKSSGFSGSAVVRFERFYIPASLGVALATILLVQRLRETAGSINDPSRSLRFRSFLLALSLALATAVMAVQQFKVAYSAGEHYAQHGQLRHSYLEGMRRGATKDSQISIAYFAGGFRNARRLSIMLSEHLGQRNIVYLPVTMGLPLEKFREKLQENFWTGDQFEQMISDRTYPADDRIHANSEIVIVISSQLLLKPFRIATKSWLDDKCYDTQFFDMNNAQVFYRTTDTPCYGVDQQDVPIRAKVVLDYVSDRDGLVKIKGYAMSNQPTTLVDVYIGDERIPDLRTHVIRKELTEFVFRNPELGSIFSGFDAEHYISPKRSNRNIEIQLKDTNDQVFYRAEFPLNAELPAVSEVGE